MMPTRTVLNMFPSASAVNTSELFHCGELTRAKTRSTSQIQTAGARTGAMSRRALPAARRNCAETPVAPILPCKAGAGRPTA